MNTFTFWLAIVYCLLIILYVCYSVFILWRHYLKMKAEKAKVRFLPKVAFIRLMENIGIITVVYMVISGLISVIINFL